jgi:hypothetical protein
MQLGIYKKYIKCINDLLRTSHKTHYVSATELQLFRETVAVYCVNHTGHINTLWGQTADIFLCETDGTHSFYWL